ncbi:MAG: DUF3394 domain-containing protein, partial [Gammaproteobacteria bacterium]|nr:DUF3394 domain-containing protein [Gammaproteobacteria bacterium]
AGAAVAKADPLKTGFKALLFAKPLYIIPFLFVYTPILLEEGSIIEHLTTVATCIIGLLALTSTLQRWFLTKLKIYEIVLMVIGGVVMFVPTLSTDALGLVLLLLATFSQLYTVKNYKGAVVV